MRCQEKNCSGEIDLNNPIPVRVGWGCSYHEPVYACKSCGCLHSKEGLIIQSRSGIKTFFKNGVFVNEKPKL